MSDGDASLSDLISECLDRGDWDSARRTLQQVAYGMLDATAQEKAAFSEVVSVFAAHDPLYRSCMEALLPIVQANPGIRQTALYDHMPAGNAEEARYVLYFANELGAIARRKKGNTYEIFPAGYAVEVIDPAR